MIRKLYIQEHGLDIGYGTYGGCWVHSALWWQKIKIGRYCSFAAEINIFTGNHHSEWFSTHPCLANPAYGAVLYNGYPKSNDHVGLEIGHDVWMGQQAIILPGCKKIGNGAIIGGGSIVTHDVPPYAIVVGNPARVIRYRFDQETIKQLEATEWWNMDLDELRQNAQKIQEIVQNK